MIFKFGGQLQPVEIEEWEAERSPAVFVTDARHAEETLARAGIIYENEIRLEKIGFCKIENQQECVAGTLCIPKLLDVLNSRYRMFFFVNRYHIVIVDDEDFSLRLIRRKRMHQGETKERFLYNFIAEFMSRDQEMLVAYERRLLEYAQQVKEAYQAQIDARQNSNMQFLTVLSTIFFPLTLITGWFGMNFRDMPGLDNGYPAVMVLSVIVILICIYIFKKKKII